MAEAPTIQSVLETGFLTVREALDALGLALVGEGHYWSAKERRLWEEADEFLTQAGISAGSTR